MATRQLDCPGCGSAIEIQSVYSSVIVCKYCNQCSQIEPNGLTAKGTNKTLLASPSKLQIGQEGQLLGSVYRILGRLRYEYSGGFWDEWFLLNDADQRIWLQEDDGEMTAFEKIEIDGQVPDYDASAPGQLIQVNGLNLFVLERTAATISGAEGELFFRITPGETVGCIDANAGGVNYSLEYADDEVSLNKGNAVSMDELDFKLR